MKFTALVPGYGVPKNILSDQNYGMYMTACFNTLFDRFADAEGTIVLSGGPTDCYPPYRRTEAGEMAKWWMRQMALARKESGRSLPWKIILDRKALTTVENVLNFKKLTGASHFTFVFVERTRVPKMRAFTKRIFGRFVSIIPIDFDASRNRYRLSETEKREKTDTAFSLAALKDPKMMAKRRAYAKRKIELLRAYPPDKAVNHLPEIHARLAKEFQT